MSLRRHAPHAALDSAKLSTRSCQLEVTMKVGVLGTGDVGKTLADACIALGHEVKLGAREAGNPKAKAWVDGAGTRASAGTFSDAARFGEIVFLCTLGSETENVVRVTGPENLAGKLLIDTTNPLAYAPGGPPKLMVPAGGSGGAQLQTLASAAHVVKAFNTVGHGAMFKPEFPGGPPDMFICGNDAGAKARTTELLRQFGWNVIDIGGIDSAHYLEAMCMVWVLSALPGSTWYQAFKLLRK
jgi:predicted dinucleotide-binding enzyme